MDLALDFFHTIINGSIHVFAAFLGAEDDTACRNRDFHNVLIAFNSHDGRDFTNSLELLRNGFNLFFHIIFQCRRYFKILTTNSNCHNDYLLTHRMFPVRSYYPISTNEAKFL